MDSMFNTLIELPLFRGVSHERMSEIVGMSRFHFVKYQRGDTILHAGDACTHLLFILSGQVRMTVLSADGSMQARQTLTAPDMIAPDFLFGRVTRYPGTATALETVNIMEVSKADYLQILNHDEIFLFNYLNYLASRAQVCFGGAMTPAGETAAKRIAWLTLALTQPGATDITLTFSDDSLKPGEDRTLETLKEEGQIDFTDNKITITDRRKITELLTPQPPADSPDTI